MGENGSVGWMFDQVGFIDAGTVVDRDGALAADSFAGRRFDRRDLAVLGELATTAGAALDHAERRKYVLREVGARVRQLVLSGDFPPGAPLSEVFLAQEFDVASEDVSTQFIGLPIPQKYATSPYTVSFVGAV